MKKRSNEAALLLAFFERNGSGQELHIYEVGNEIGLKQLDVATAARSLEQQGLFTMPSGQTAMLTDQGLLEASRLAASWPEREQVLLEALKDFEAQGGRPSFEKLLEATGLERRQAEFGLRALLDGGFVGGIDASSFDGFDMLEIELRAGGRQALGAWGPGGRGYATREGEIESVRVFISHSSTDAKVGRGLVDLLRVALGLAAKDIRCTSVDGYRMRAGADTDEQLRREIFSSDTFVGLLSPESLKSPYVLFELGARWGANRHLAPLLISGATPADLGGPLAGLNALDGRNRSQVIQLVENLAEELAISVQPVASWANHVEEFLAGVSASN